MVTSSFWGGRSRHATSSSRRSHRSLRDSTRSTGGEGEGGEEQLKPTRPDGDEVRNRRLAYYTASPADRKRIAPPASSKTKLGSTTSSKEKSTPTSDGRHKRRKHKSSPSSHTSRNAREVTEDRDRTEEYVYGTRPPPALERIDEEPQRRRNSEAGDYTPSRHHRSSRRRSTVDVVDDDVTPEDSISQVGYDRSPRTRPSLKRRSTTSTKLDPVVEQPESTKSPVSSKRPRRPESSILGSVFRRHSTTSVPQTPVLMECMTCTDKVPSTKSAKLACDHRWCHDCLRIVFDMSVKDPAHMPPKCCTDQHIPLSHVDKLYDIKFKTLWNRKYQEYHTKNRLYCPTPKCGNWIKPSHIHKEQGRKFATCPRCRTKICALCSNKMHRSTDCPKDPEIAKILEQGKEEGWQRCYSCKAMVEKKEGCNHMTCLCTAEFCIVCGSKWKSCDCPWFDYSALPRPDRLNDMRVPEPMQDIYRRFFEQVPDAIPPRPRAPERRAAGPPAEVTYQQEVDQRARQERLDADLARRLQLASLMDPEDGFQPQRRRNNDDFGLGNAARHFMNEASPDGTEAPLSPLEWYRRHSDTL